MARTLKTKYCSTRLDNQFFIIWRIGLCRSEDLPVVRLRKWLEMITSNVSLLRIAKLFVLHFECSCMIVCIVGVAGGGARWGRGCSTSRFCFVWLLW